MPIRKGSSKFLSLILRHKPESISLHLDENGWAVIADIAEKSSRSGVKLTPQMILQIAATSEKKRFCISDDGMRIRANQGQSINVDLGLHGTEPPELLFHGTARHNLTSIRTNGIKRGKRNHVHLSADKESAVRVGKRHGTPIVLVVKSRQMYHEGYSFYLSENGVWLTEYVPPDYLVFQVHG